jgi:hypothetical protein
MLNRFRNQNRTSMKNETAIARSSAAVIDTLEDRKLMAAANGAIGINVNDASSSFMNTAVPVMKKMGVTSVRLWYTADFNSKYFGGTLQRAIDYSNKGFDVMVIVQPKDGKVYAPETVKSWFNWAAGNTSLKNAVDRWEVGNEPDHDQYWKGSLSSYVTQLLKPAYEALKSKGETVVSAGPSWDSRDVGEMINAGMLNYTDMVGYHPYAKGVSLVKQRISEINSVVRGRKPIVASEWNVRGFESGSKTDWANAVKQVYPSIKGGFAYNYYFALKTQNSMAGPAGILRSDGSANTPFYNAFATFSGQSGVSVPSTGGSTSSGSTGGSTTVGTGSASISGTLWNDTDGDGNWDSNEVSSGARTVFLDYDGDGQLDSSEKRVTSASNGSYKFTGLAAGTYKVTRVFPSGFKLSNSASKYLTVSVTSGQQKTGVNIGSTDK